MKLFFLILGCKPKWRYTEQHDVFFGIGNSLKELIPQIEQFWPDAGKIHIDSWREVNMVNGYSLKIVPKENAGNLDAGKLFFINLGGYKPIDIEEYHYKLLQIAESKSDAIAHAKQTAFYLHNFMSPHIDDKYGVDVDDIFEIEEILSEEYKEKYRIVYEKIKEHIPEDDLHIGYLRLEDI